MELKKMICKIVGHKKGFLHKYENYYEYACPRCKETIVEKVKTKDHKVNTAQISQGE